MNTNDTAIRAGILRPDVGLSTARHSPAKLAASGIFRLKLSVYRTLRFDSLVLIRSETMMDFAKARFNMVEQQVRPWDVLDDRVLNVIGNIPREKFTPVEFQNLAYSDSRIPLADGNVMLNPNIIGRILQHTDIQEDEIALEIGTGSGYLTACMASLAHHVDSVEIDGDMADAARERLEAMGFDNIVISEGDGSKGWKQKRFYDVIIITGSLQAIPESYKQLLSVGGRLFVITGDAPVMSAQLVTRVDEKNWTVEEMFETCVDRLNGTQNPSVFTF